MSGFIWPCCVQAMEGPVRLRYTAIGRECCMGTKGLDSGFLTGIACRGAVSS